jgi:hypothetical protein
LNPDSDSKGMKNLGENKQDKMKKAGIVHHEVEYEAPLFFLVVFYALLVLWTGISLIFLWPKVQNGVLSVFQVGMIAFILAYTWYFSLGIFYSIRIKEDGTIQMKSIRRIMHILPEGVDTVEGPRFGVLPYGFIRFRLDREKVYLFCHITNSHFARLLAGMKRANGHLKFKGVYPVS